MLKVFLSPVSTAESGVALIRGHRALGVVRCGSAGDRRAELAAVMPEAEQQGTHCLIRLSGSGGTAVCLKGFKGGFWKDSGRVT